MILSRDSDTSCWRSCVFQRVKRALSKRKCLKGRSNELLKTHRHYVNESETKSDKPRSFIDVIPTWYKSYFPVKSIERGRSFYKHRTVIAGTRTKLYKIYSIRIYIYMYIKIETVVHRYRESRKTAHVTQYTNNSTFLISTSKPQPYFSSFRKQSKLINLI